MGLAQPRIFIRDSLIADYERHFKGVFFSESAMSFLNLQISKKNISKNYPELEI